MKEEKLYLTANEIAVRLGIAVRTVWRLRATGVLPPADFRVGRRVVRWRVATIDEWLAGGHGGSAQAPPTDL